MVEPNRLFVDESAAVYEDEAARVLQLGPLDLLIRRGKADWYIGVRRDAAAGDDRWHAETVDPPPDIPWQRFAVKSGQRALRFDPALPPRPVVVRPESPYRILPGERIGFFVGVPLWIRVGTADPEPVMMCEQPTAILSKTWYGTPVAGELGFAMRSRARRSWTDLDPRAYRIVCPVRLKNAHDQPLDFERLCVRVQHLAVFAGRSRFWTNEVGITYQGPDQWSRMVVAKTPPSLEEVAGASRPPREQSDGRLHIHTMFGGRHSP